MPTPTLPRLQPFDTAPHHRAKGKVLVHLHRRSTRCIIMHPVYVVCISPGFRTGGTAGGGGEEREKGCTHVRRRRASRIVSRTYEQAREKAGEGQKGSWNPSPPPLSVGIPYEEKDRQTKRESNPSSPRLPTRPRLLDLPPQLPQYRPPLSYLSLLLLPTPAPVLPIHHPAWFHPPETASFPRRVDRKFNRMVLEYFLGGIFLLLLLNRA